MNRNALYLMIGALAAAAIVLGFLLYRDQQKTTGIEVNVGEHQLTIEKK